MKRSRFSDEQIIGIWKEHQAGLSATELCRKYGVSDATFYKWRSRYGGMDVSESRRLKSLVEERQGPWQKCHSLTESFKGQPVEGSSPFEPLDSPRCSQPNVARTTVAEVWGPIS